MTTPDLLTYIKSELKLGISRQAIEQNLLSRGWKIEDVEEGFSVVGASADVPASPPVPAPAASLASNPVSTATLPAIPTSALASEDQPFARPMINPFEPSVTSDAASAQLLKSSIADAEPIRTASPRPELMGGLASAVVGMPIGSFQPAAPTVAAAAPRTLSQSVFAQSMRGSPQAESSSPMERPSISQPQPQPQAQFQSQQPQQFASPQASAAFSAGSMGGDQTENALSILPKKSHHGGLIAFVILILLLVGGGVAYAAYTGIIPIPAALSSLPFFAGSQGSYDSAQLLGALIASSGKVQSASYGLTLSAQMDNRSPAIVSFTLPAGTPPSSPAGQFLSTLNSIAYIPSDFNLNGTVTSTSQAVASSTNVQANVVGSLTFNGITLNANVQAEKVGSDAYVLINEFPSAVVNLSPILEKWVEVDQSDLALFGIPSLSSPAASSSPADKQEIAADEKALIGIFEQDQVLSVVGQPVKDMVGTDSAYRYDLTYDPANLLKFLQDAVNYEKQDPLASPANTAMLEQEAVQFQDPSYLQELSYLQRSMTFSVWMDGQGIPVKGAFNLSLIPSTVSTSTPNKQLDVALSMTLSNINQPVSITAPAASITFAQAEQAIEAAMFTPTGNASGNAKIVAPTKAVAKH